MATTFEDWYKNMAPVSRAYMTLAAATTIGCHLEIVSPFTFYFNYDLIREKYEVRIIRCVNVCILSECRGYYVLFSLFLSLVLSLSLCLSLVPPSPRPACAARSEFIAVQLHSLQT
eukprot:TRINITY_DN2752_c0_g1_i1.p1 TRINITY_DN2752_c0_g1~~TRINITY_DN2752_c0_g1_i1.p1  ORF type:complete len:116 (+),score=8.33 TRINITY_DN2752_c0_g1_i1:224-571(+)